MIRLASVRYLNAKPLTDALDRDVFSIVEGHPFEIAELLQSGEVDVALVPVASVLASSVDLRIIGGVAIGANGPVESVKLVAETPPHEWTTLLLDGVSRSSVALTKVLLASSLGETLSALTSVRDVAPTTALASAAGTTAALVIGDVARDLPARFEHEIDLAALWTSTTGLPFVFAVWACRPTLSPIVASQIVAAGRRGVAQIPERYTGEDRRYLQDALCYDLDDRALMGLRRFAALGVRAGLFTNSDCALLPPISRLPSSPVFHELAHHGQGGVELVVGNERAAAAALGMLDASFCDFSTIGQLPPTGAVILRCRGANAIGQISAALALAKTREVGLIVPDDIIDIAEAAVIWGGLNVVVLTDNPSESLVARIGAIMNPPVPRGGSRPPQGLTR